MFKKSLAVGITFLFVASIITPTIVGYNTQSFTKPELEKINYYNKKYEKTYNKSPLEKNDDHNLFTLQKIIRNKLMMLRDNGIKLFPPDDGREYDFGWAVDIDGDYAIVSAPSWTERDFPGSAFVYNKFLNTWQQQDVLFAPDGYNDDGFGFDVAIDGDYAVVSEYDYGSVYVFKRTGNKWDNKVKLLPSNEEGRFERYVSIDGDYIIVGAPSEYHENCSVYIFKRENDNWYEQSRIVVSSSVNKSFFGYSVDIDGDYAIVGAPAEEYGDEDGAAYILKRNGDEWHEQTKLHDTSSEYSSDRFGASVSISGDYAVASAPFDLDDTSESLGSVYVYKRNGEEWEKHARLVSPKRSLVPFDYFGYSVSIDGIYIIVGAPINEYYDVGGTATVFQRVGDDWKKYIEFENPEGFLGDWFGWDVSISGKNVIISAPGDNNYIGSVTIFNNVSKGKPRLMERIMDILNL